MIKNSLRIAQSYQRLALRSQPSVFSQSYQMRFFSPLVNIMLPDLGEGTKEATIKEILVKPGQRVEEVSHTKSHEPYTL